MLIASRNQIECEKLGGGYVNNFTTEKFLNMFLEKNKRIKLCRDHSGPFLNDNEKKIKLQRSNRANKDKFKNRH